MVGLLRASAAVVVPDVEDGRLERLGLPEGRVRLRVVRAHDRDLGAGELNLGVHRVDLEGVPQERDRRGAPILRRLLVQVEQRVACRMAAQSPCVFRIDLRSPAGTCRGRSDSSCFRTGRDTRCRA